MMRTRSFLAAQLPSILAVAAMSALLTTNLFGANLVVNGDFESDADQFTTWPGYAADGDNPAEISGWTGAGGRGVNPITNAEEARDLAPFRNNGDNDSFVAFLQGDSSIQQDVTGLEVGTEYVLSLDFNSRDCCGDFPIAEILLNDTIVGSSTDLFPVPGSVPPVGGAEPWYHADIDFTATETSATLKISSGPGAGGDATLILDNISIEAIPEPSTCMLLLCGLLGVLTTRRSRS